LGVEGLIARGPAASVGVLDVDGAGMDVEVAEFGVTALGIGLYVFKLKKQHQRSFGFVGEADGVDVSGVDSGDGDVAGDGDDGVVAGFVGALASALVPSVGGCTGVVDVDAVDAVGVDVVSKNASMNGSMSSLAVPVAVVRKCTRYKPFGQVIVELLY